MVTTIAYLNAYVGADISAFRRGMQQVRGEIFATTDALGSIRHAASLATLAFTVPVVAGFSAAIDQAMDFNAAMRNVNSIAFLSEERFRSLSEEVRLFGRETRTGADGAALSLNTILQAGFGLNNISDAFTVMEYAVRTAEAGLADTTITTEALVASLLAYGVGVESIELHSNILTRMVQVGVGSMQNFASAIGQAMPIASAAGISFMELGSSIAFLTQRGYSPDEAATRIKNAIKKLLDPTEELQALFQQIGVRDGQELLATFGGLEGAVMAIGRAVNFDASQLPQIFGEIRANEAMMSFINNSDAFQASMAEFAGAIDGVTDAARQQQVLSFSYQFDVLKSKIEALAIKVGPALLPVFSYIVWAVEQVVESFESLDSETLGLVIGFIAIAAVLPPLIWLFTALFNPVTLVVGAIGLLLAKLIEGAGGFENFVTIAKEKFEAFGWLVMEIFDKVRNFIASVLWRIGHTFEDELFILVTTAEYLVGEIISRFTSGDWSGIETVIRNVAHVLVNIFELYLLPRLVRVFEDIKTSISDAIEGIRSDIANWIASLPQADLDQFVVTLTSLATAFLTFGIVFAIVKAPAAIAAFALAIRAAIPAVAMLTLGTQLWAVSTLRLGAAFVVANIKGVLAAILAVLTPINAALAFGALLILAYQNNWLGFRDFIENTVRPTLQWLKDTLEEINRLFTLLPGGDIRPQHGISSDDLRRGSLFGGHIAPPLPTVSPTGWRPGDLGGAAPNPAIYDYSTQTYIVTLNEVNDIDRMLMELRRRGINLERRN